MKKLIILSLIVLILSMSCVSAEDINQTDSDDIIMSDGFTGNFGELQDLIDNAAENDTITLTKDYNGSGEISIEDKVLTIDGNGHYIDANSQSCIFSIFNSEMLLMDLAFYNANEAEYGGGAIYSDSSIVGILNCEFINNYAIYGGAIASFDGELYVYESVFTDNIGENAAAAIHGENVLEVVGCQFTSQYDGMEFINYYGNATEGDGYLYLENNTMQSPYVWSVLYDGDTPIESETYLVFTDLSNETAENIPLVFYVDNYGNMIAIEEIDVQIYDNATNKLVDSQTLYYDEENGYAYTNTALASGVYRTTGSVASQYAKYCTVVDGSLTISGDEPEKTTPTVTTTSQVSGNQVTLTATLSPTAATGTVTFSFNGKTYNANVKNGKATTTVSDLADGTYNVKTTYNGDSNYNTANADDIAFTVKTTSEKTTPTVTTTSQVNGNQVTLTATLNPTAATGTVTFNVNNQDYTANIRNGRATTTISDLADATYNVKTTYNGDSNYNTAKAQAILFKISTQTQKLTPTITTTSQVNGNQVTLTATLNPTAATGTVTFNVNNQDYTTNIRNGRATTTISDLADATYNVKTTYNGNANYNEATAKDISFTIKTANPTSETISAPAVEKYCGGDERFVVTLKDSDGNPISGGNVKITLNGQTYNRTTQANGATSIAIGLPAGDYDAEVEYNGETITSSVKVKSTMEGNDLTKMFRNESQYYIKVLDTKGNPLTGKKVTFNINGVFYDRNINESGIARMNINLEPNTYIITAKNPENGEQYSNTITVLSTITENHDVTKYYRNGTQYVIRLLDAQGNPVKAGETVTFNINGVFYNRNSNASGHVKMNINLEPKDYIITADYNGCKVSNHIRVLSVLSGRDVNMKHMDGSQYVFTLLDGQGNPYSGEKVTLNINGVFYTRTTDANGQGKLTINLNPATYIITATYNGYSTSNNIVVNANINTYECGNGHRLEIISTATVVENNEGVIYGYGIYYPDGAANFSAESISASVSEYVNEFTGYGAVNMGYYKGWVILDWTPLIRQYGLALPNYTMHYKDGYFYSSGSYDLNFVKRVVDSFK